MSDERYIKELEKRNEQLEDYIFGEWQRRSDYVALLEVLITDLSLLEEKIELVAYPKNPMDNKEETTNRIRDRMVKAFKQSVHQIQSKCRDTHYQLSAKPEVLK